MSWFNMTVLGSKSVNLTKNCPLLTLLQIWFVDITHLLKMQDWNHHRDRRALFHIMNHIINSLSRLKLSAAQVDLKNF